MLRSTIEMAAEWDDDEDELPQSLQSTSICEDDAERQSAKKEIITNQIDSVQTSGINENRTHNKKRFSNGVFEIENTRDPSFDKLNSNIRPLNKEIQSEIRPANSDSGENRLKNSLTNNSLQAGSSHRQKQTENCTQPQSSEGEKKPIERYIPPPPTTEESKIFDTGISRGINFNKYEQIPVKVSDGAPSHINSFEQAGLKELLLKNVKKSNYTIPTPIQKYAIPIIKAKRDIMAVAQTGSGKTAAFLLPIINNLLTENHECTSGKPLVLIISPTRELSIQIYNEARKFALGSYLKIQIVYGGTDKRYEMKNLLEKCHILVCTPGRIVDFLDSRHISLENIKFVVLDEADRLLDYGFIPTIFEIMESRTMSAPEKRQMIMFSATFPQAVQKLAGQFLSNYIFLAVGIVGGACEDVEQNFIKMDQFDKRAKLMDIITESNPSGTIIFVATKRTADFLAAFISECDIPTTSIHGDRLQREREEALSDFKEGRMKVLVATGVAARGLDIKNISHVINFDMPQDINEYVHRIGRTGRVGNRGKATSFYDSSRDFALAADLTRILKSANQPVPSFIECGYAQAFDRNNRNRNRRFGAQDIRLEGSIDFKPKSTFEAQEPDEKW